MAHAIELFFDASSEQKIKGIWADLASAGLPSTMLENGQSRPHVTLLASHRPLSDAVQPALARLAAVESPFKLHLDQLGFFKGAEGAIFLGVTPTQRLMQLHQAAYDALAHLMPELWPHYLPGKLAFHCTLTQGLKPEQAAQALELAWKEDFPIEVQVSSLGLVSFPPVKQIAQYPLGPLEREDGGKSNFGDDEESDKLTRHLNKDY